jgi:hypothetical protein
MTLFDRVSHAYIRQLANRSVSVKRSKLNILVSSTNDLERVTENVSLIQGCSTGDIISNMVIRMKSGACFDPAIGRFLFWPLDGPVIPDRLFYRSVDTDNYPSMEQFVVALSFIENVTFSFEQEAIEEVVKWGNSCKQKSMRSTQINFDHLNTMRLGFENRNSDECLSARLGKSVQHVYRMAAFLETIEIGFALCEEYVDIHTHFPIEGKVDAQFMDDIQHLLELKHAHTTITQSSQSFRISKATALRAIDLIACNMRQFTMLFDSSNAPRVSAIGRQIVVVSPEQNHSNSDRVSANAQSKSSDLKRKSVIIT